MAGKRYDKTLPLTTDGAMIVARVAWIERSRANHAARASGVPLSTFARRAIVREIERVGFGSFVPGGPEPIDDRGE
jgi:hypothetical protein